MAVFFCVVKPGSGFENLIRLQKSLRAFLKRKKFIVCFERCLSVGQKNSLGSWEVRFHFFVRKVLGHDRIQKIVWIFTTHIRNTVEFLVCECVICNLRVHTEWRIAYFWRTSHYDGKISPGWWGWGGGRPPPFSLLPSRTKLQCTLLLSGKNTHPVSSLPLFVCNLWFRWFQDWEAFSATRAILWCWPSRIHSRQPSQVVTSFFPKTIILVASFLRFMLRNILSFLKMGIFVWIF